MIWRSTLAFLTSLTALILLADSLRAESVPLLIAQSSLVNPDSAIDTGQATPNIHGTSSTSPLQNATSEQQIAEIKSLQQELQNRGYYNGPIDGIYGPGTAEAIRVLKGQEGGQLTPRLFTPDLIRDGESPAIAPPKPANPAENRGEAPPTNAEPEAINIGDQVSPETGVQDAETAEPANPSSEDAANSTAPETKSSKGLGSVLWPGLALIAALGSFGVGFVLANRGKTKTHDEIDPAWRAIDDQGPQAVRPPNVVQPSQNGRTTTNGTSLDPTAPTDHAHHRPYETASPTNNTANPLEERLPIVSSNNGVGPTTRLVKADVMDQLVSNLQVDNPAQRRKAIWELGQRGNSSAVQHLVNSMINADSKEKSLILAALSEIGIRSLKPMSRALAIALQDDNPDVRKNAIRDLTRVYDLVTQISQMLGHAIEDEDPDVRRTAEWALGQLNHIREAPKLKSSLNSLEASRSSSELLSDEMENLKN